MIISFLVGAAIGYCIGTAIAEIFFTIYDKWSARSRIKEEAKQREPKINKLLVFANQCDSYNDEEELVIHAYDSNNNHIANINVTAPNGTDIEEGDILYV